MALNLELEEQERLSALRAFFDQWRVVIFGVLFLLSVVIVGQRVWQYYAAQQMTEAGRLFDGLQAHLQKGDKSQFLGVADTLTRDYSKTVYASMGALLVSKYLFEAHDYAEANRQLDWVAEHGVSSQWRDLARLRLVQLFIEQAQTDKALKVLETTAGPGFDMRYLEARGDVYLFKDDRDKAREAYAAALKIIDQPVKGDPTDRFAEMRRSLLDKLSLLGESSPQTVSSGAVK